MYIMIQQVIENGRLFRYQQGVESIAGKIEKELSQKFGVTYAIAALISALVGIGIGPEGCRV